MLRWRLLCVAEIFFSIVNGEWGSSIMNADESLLFIMCWSFAYFKRKFVIILSRHCVASHNVQLSNYWQWNLNKNDRHFVCLQKICREPVQFGFVQFVCLFFAFCDAANVDAGPNIWLFPNVMRERQSSARPRDNRKIHMQDRNE